jgi:hypothetical protein
MGWNLKQKAQDHTVSIGLGLIVLLLLTVWQAVDPSVWGKVSEAVPKRALWALLALESITICLLVAYAVQIKRRTSNRLKPLFGVLWDKDAHPYCPVCSVLMHFNEPSIKLWKATCPKCKTVFTVIAQGGWLVTLEDVKQRLQTKTQK